jgi:hypothetical protein
MLSFLYVMIFQVIIIIIFYYHFCVNFFLFVSFPLHFYFSRERETLTEGMRGRKVGWSERKERGVGVGGGETGAAESQLEQMILPSQG